MYYSSGFTYNTIDVAMKWEAIFNIGNKKSKRKGEKEGESERREERKKNEKKKGKPRMCEGSRITISHQDLERLELGTSTLDR